ncbi:Conserved_hypothetical protein [Hexamita inflata]|uniref:Myb-like domain-containing protein n=1 Tax=Hexamita inflata TaxID=28002 RepID=A0AA86V909_9EUKA|nr:Conserved hypothetical protein [Hexamita inflata]
MNITLTVIRNRWTLQEKERFIQLFKVHNINFDKYVPHFENKTASQIKSFYRNALYNKRMRENEKQVNQQNISYLKNQSFDSTGHKEVVQKQANDMETLDYFCDI